MAHLVDRPLGPVHVARRVIGIARVLFGIVPRRAQLDPGPGGQGHGCSVPVEALPVEVPVVDTDQRFDGFVAHARPHLHLPTEQVHVRVDRDHVDGPGHEGFGLDLVARHPCGNRERELTDTHELQALLHGPFGQTESQLGVISLHRRPRVVIVELEHHARSLGQEHAHAVGQEPGTCSRRPAAKIAIDPHARATEARIAVQAVPRREARRVPRRIHHGQHVMDDLRVSRHDIGGGEVAVFRERGRHAEAAVDVAGARRHGEGPLGAQYEVRRGQGRRAGEFPRRREIARIALGRAGRDPASHRGDLGVGEPALACQIAVARDRFPRRHVPLLYRFEKLGPS